MREIKFLIPYIVVTSFNYYFAKDGLNYSSPLAFMGLRYLLSGIILVAISRKLILSREIILLTFATVGSTMFWIYGLIYISPAESAVLSYSMPLFSLPLAFLIVGERPTKIEVLGIVIGFAGVVIYGLPLLSGFTLLGAVLTLINALFWGTFSVMYRRLKDQDPFAVNATQFLIGALIMLAISPIDFRIDITPAFTLDFLWVVTAGGVLQFVLWNLMIRTSRVNRITVLAFTVPIFTIIIGVFTTRIIPDMFSIAGVCIMFIGILLSRLRRGIAVVNESEKDAVGRQSISMIEFNDRK
ncbi:MAG TPA: DMT family transporter [Thermoplasmataceae archaeon]|nr:DMT family transporter [Thermoplasmatales archaeon AK]HLH85604.1 DMT family transporter [Thermoplasmataceae archaeon]